MTELQVLKTNRFLQNTQHPAATEAVLETSSVRDAIECAVRISNSCRAGEYVRVTRVSDDANIDFQNAAIAMNGFTLITDVRHGRKVHNGRIEFQALGKIETTNELNKFRERIDHIRYGNYEN